MSVLDDIRDGKGLKPITSTYCTCQKGMTNIITHPETNADRIRSMTDEELARFLWQAAPYDNCPPITCIEFETRKKPTTDECIACWGRWLRTEVTE